jgi:hypothetical protein
LQVFFFTGKITILPLPFVMKCRCFPVLVEEETIHPVMVLIKTVDFRRFSEDKEAAFCAYLLQLKKFNTVMIYYFNIYICTYSVIGVFLRWWKLGISDDHNFHTSVMESRYSLFCNTSATSPICPIFHTDNNFSRLLNKKTD